MTQEIEEQEEMIRLQRYLLYIRNNSVKNLILTVGRTVWYKGQMKMQKIHDDHRDSSKLYKAADKGLQPVSIETVRLDLSQIKKEMADELWEMYRQHRFDLLGSGWEKSSFIQDCRGLDGYHYPNPVIKTDSEGKFLKKIMRRQNYANARKIFSHIKGEYEPIDWQKDFKSGYRWGADRWYRPQETAKKPGGDIKVPWELSRLQHLPRLAVLSRVLPEKKEIIYKEFHNQLLDFIAQNPVRMGVNHMCTMDVGIRVANIALACSLWKGMGQTFEADFERIVTNYIFNECEFIRKNLEWSYYLTSNHYFADIAGLLWGSAVLPESRKRSRWLRFSRNQIINEILKQFHKEGSNAEGSTAYHRLTGEMAGYSAALIRYLAREGSIMDAPQEIYNILYKAGRFTNDIMRPDERFTQIGDNDSGLFFRLSITGSMPENGKPEEDLNDGRPFVSAIYGMFGCKELEHAGLKYPLECSLMQDLCGRNTLHCDAEKKISVKKHHKKALEYRKEYFIDGEGRSLLKNIRRIDYPEFGLYIFRSDELYLCVNLSDNGQKGNAGHAHNDKLSFELFIGGKCIFEDPGTYVYTPLPEMRDLFRSTQYHNTIFCGEEQNRYNGMFSMYDDTRCFVLELGKNVIEARVEYRGHMHERRLEILDAGIKVVDWCSHEFVQQFEQKPAARGYGKLTDRR